MNGPIVVKAMNGSICRIQEVHNQIDVNALELRQLIDTLQKALLAINANEMRDFPPIGK